MAFKPKTYEIVIDKLVHGGQGLGTLDHGKKALVWNVLPGEKVRFTTRKSKSSFIEGVAEEILKPSAERIEPHDELYLSTSPWQMMSYEAENKYKTEILAETLQRGGVDVAVDSFYAPAERWHYRNKMEYSFYGDSEGLHLALYNRGTHMKQIVEGSSIARPEIDTAALAICRLLGVAGVRAGDLKSLILRCNRAGDVVGALFTRNEAFNENFIKPQDLPCKGLSVYFSNPKSPASVPTKLLHAYGEQIIEDELIGRVLKYDALSFFQVNLDPYEEALKKIKEETAGYQATDMYSGVGSIGLSVGAVKLVELDEKSAAMAQLNAGKTEIVVAASEKALEHIPTGAGKAVIFDPPRAGLHAKLTEEVLQKLPEKIIYLSCNPSTLARDLNLLQEKYKITGLRGYNFFPATPHIEALAILERV